MVTSEFSIFDKNAHNKLVSLFALTWHRLSEYCTEQYSQTAAKSKLLKTSIWKVQW